MGIFTREQRVEEGGLWEELAHLTPLPNNPLQYVNVFVRKYTRYVYVQLKSFTCYKKSLNGGYSRQTPPKVLPTDLNHPVCLI